MSPIIAMMGVLKKAKDISEKTEADVFFEYAPHVEWIKVEIFSEGWESQKRSDEEYIVKLDDAAGGNLTKVYNRLKKLEEELTWEK